MLGADRRHQADLGPGELADLADLALDVGAHLNDEIVHRLVERQLVVDHHAHAHQGVVALGRRQHAIAPAQNMSQIFLGAGLAIAARDPDHGWPGLLEPAAGPLAEHAPEPGLDRVHQRVGQRQDQRRQVKHHQPDNRADRKPRPVGQAEDRVQCDLGPDQRDHAQGGRCD